MAVAADASDVILKANSQPAMKVSGKVLFVEDGKVSPDEARNIAERIASENAISKFDERGEVDLAYDAGDAGRFRVNIFRQGGEVGMVLRQIKANIPGFAQLHLPERAFQHFANLDRGIIFVTGVTGSGKKTSLA